MMEPLPYTQTFRPLTRLADFGLWAGFSLRTIALLLVLVFSFIMSFGCQAFERGLSDTVWGHGVDPVNYHAARAIDANYRNLVILPVEGVRDPDIGDAIYTAFADEMLRTNRFRVLPNEEGAIDDADLFMQIEVSAFDPYPPLGLGVRLSIATIDTGTVLWAADQYFSAGDPAVARSARRYGQTHQRRDYPVQSGESVLLSPKRFSRFVAEKLYSTLPPLSYVPEDAT